MEYEIPDIEELKLILEGSFLSDITETEDKDSSEVGGEGFD